MQCSHACMHAACTACKHALRVLMRTCIALLLTACHLPCQAPAAGRRYPPRSWSGVLQSWAPLPVGPGTPLLGSPLPLPGRAAVRLAAGERRVRGSCCEARSSRFVTRGWVHPRPPANNEEEGRSRGGGGAKPWGGPKPRGLRGRGLRGSERTTGQGRRKRGTKGTLPRAAVSQTTVVPNSGTTALNQEAGCSAQLLAMLPATLPKRRQVTVVLVGRGSDAGVRFEDRSREGACKILLLMQA